VRFVITETLQEMPVTYVGLLPDLFKEGKGVVAQGKLGDDGIFVASEVLAKHDENYMPPEAKHAMDQAAAAKASQSLKP
jgi:cytochrome c-type biogenesis protein CcmE